MLIRDLWCLIQTMNAYLFLNYDIIVILALKLMI